MKKILLFTLLNYLITSYAYNWVNVTEVDGQTYYVDDESIKKYNEFVYYWTMYDYLEPIEELGFLSGIGKYKVNCKEKKQTWLTLSLYSQNMGKGKLLSEEKPNQTIYLEPRMPMYQAMKFACNPAAARSKSSIEFSSHIKKETKKRFENFFKNK